MFDELKAEYGISPAAMTDIIEEGATRFFRRRYDTT
jgi:hypothetical protein